MLSPDAISMANVRYVRMRRPITLRRGRSFGNSVWNSRSFLRQSRLFREHFFKEIAYPCLVDLDHLTAELYNLVNGPQAFWINEAGRMV